MWINIQGININFNLILQFTRKENTIILKDITNKNENENVYYYNTITKAKQVEKYIMNKLNEK